MPWHMRSLVFSTFSLFQLLEDVILYRSFGAIQRVWLSSGHIFVSLDNGRRLVTFDSKPVDLIQVRRFCFVHQNSECRIQKCCILYSLRKYVFKNILGKTERILDASIFYFLPPGTFLPYLTHYHTMLHFDALKIYSCGKHYEKRRICLEQAISPCLTIFSTLYGTYFSF